MDFEERLRRLEEFMDAQQLADARRQGRAELLAEIRRGIWAVFKALFAPALAAALTAILMNYL